MEHLIMYRRTLIPFKYITHINADFVPNNSMRVDITQKKYINFISFKNCNTTNDVICYIKF